MVQQCLTLDIDQMVRRRILQPGSRTRGTMSWNDEHGRVLSSISYQADVTNPSDSWLRLIFSTPDVRTGQPRLVDQRIPLTMTHPYLGGERWWFVDGGCRVGRLHLPPGGDRFRCRRAYGLVYQSQYESRSHHYAHRASVTLSNANAGPGLAN
jgi:hypothetical protein